MGDDNIERMYWIYGILADAQDISKHEELYEEILAAVQGSERERRLACQFIPRFFGHFPNLADRALECLFDLCEDTEISIRKQVIKELPAFCRDNSDYNKKTANILSQLLQAKDVNELIVVHNSLFLLFQIDAEGAVSGIFNQIRIGDEVVREKCLHFISTKIKTLPVAYIPKLENVLIQEIKVSFDEASPDEIPIFMDLLFWTKLGKNIQGHGIIMSMVATQVEAEKPFKASDDDLVERLIAFCKALKPLFKSSTPPHLFIQYFAEEVLPNLKQVNGYEDCTGNSLELLKLFAEMSLHCGHLTKPELVVGNVYKLLLDIFPFPENGTENFQEAKFQFSYVECLLFTFHKFYKLFPAIFNDECELSNFRARLQYFSRALQGYIRTLHSVIKEQTSDDKTLENEIKAVALKTTLNINVLIKDFFHNPPINKSVIHLSWTIPKRAGTNNLLKLKRFSYHNVVYDQNKRLIRTPKMVREIYQPPNGKYSRTYCNPTRNRL